MDTYAVFIGLDRTIELISSALLALLDTEPENLLVDFDLETTLIFDLGIIWINAYGCVPMLCPNGVLYCFHTQPKITCHSTQDAALAEALSMRG